MEQFVAPMRAMLDQLDARASDLRDELAGVDAERRRLRQAIRALVPVTTPEKPKPAPKTGPGSLTWRPKDAVLDAARALARENGGTTANEVMQATKVSIGTARQALEVLRRDEELRLAGKRGKGEKVYKLMTTTAAVS